MNRIFKNITLAGVLVLGIGCGGTELEERKVEDMIAALDPAEEVLHVQEGSQDIALKELQAVRQSDGYYLSKDELTGEQARFIIKPYPLSFWPTLFKRCSNGQYVLSWQQCPILIAQDPLNRIWIRASCSWKIQSAAVGLCTASGTGSYRYQYQEAWRCGVGTGICRERRAATVLRYNYAFSACSTLSSVTTTGSNYLCRR